MRICVQAKAKWTTHGARPKQSENGKPSDTSKFPMATPDLDIPRPCGELRMGFPARDVPRTDRTSEREQSGFFLRPIGDPRWDLILWATGLIALLGIPIVYLLPDKVPLVWFTLVALPATGPLSPVIPVAFEPLIFEIAKYEPPLTVAVVSVCVYSYTEYLNWHLYGWAVGSQRLAGMRKHRVIRHAVTLFAHAPFLGVFVFALSPLPFWVVRVLALLRRYRLRRFLLAMALGRFPRVLLLAWVGAQLRLSTLLLVAVVAFAAVVGVLWYRFQTAQGAFQSGAERAV